MGQGPRTDIRLAIALAGRDPDVHEERGHALRADYLRLLALGLPPGRAEPILGISGAGAWQGDDPTFAAACDAVSAASPPYGASRVIRLTPQRVARFLEELSKPGTTVIAAAAAIGVSSAAVYQRRGRDAEFARAWQYLLRLRGVPGPRHVVLLAATGEIAGSSGGALATPACQCPSLKTGQLRIILRLAAG